MKRGVIIAKFTPDIIAIAVGVLIFLIMALIFSIEDFGDPTLHSIEDKQRSTFPLTILHSEINNMFLTEHIIEIIKNGCNDQQFRELFDPYLNTHKVKDYAWSVEKDKQELCPMRIPSNARIVDSVSYFFPNQNAEVLTLNIKFYHPQIQTHQEWGGELYP